MIEEALRESTGKAEEVRDIGLGTNNLFPKLIVI
jgi:hypothetical protein